MIPAPKLKHEATELPDTQIDLPVARPHYTVVADARPHQTDPEDACVLEQGRVLLERYEVRHHIGSGGMGSVYAAFDRTLGKEIALKILRFGLLRHERARQRFLSEGRLASELSHPHIVNVSGVERDGDLHFILMELLDGKTLREKFKELHEHGRKYDVEQVRRVGFALCEALHYAHRWAVHGDIKPENIFLCSDGTVKLLDFGVARILDVVDDLDDGSSGGTHGYMSPEQVLGDAELTHRSDQYALAGVLYEALTGEVPVGRARSAHQARPDVPRSLSAALDRALSSKPGDRHRNMAEFSAALAAPGFLKELLHDPRALASVFGALVIVMTLIGWLAFGGSKDGTDPKSAAIEAQGTVMALRERLSAALSNLRDRLRDAEQKKAAQDQWILERVDATVQRSVLEGADFLRVEGKLRLGSELVKQQEYPDALEAFHEASDTLRQLLAVFSSVEEAARAELGARSAEHRWQALQGQKRYPESDATRQAALAIENGVQLLRAGQYDGATAEFARAEERFRTGIEQAPEDAYRAAQEVRSRELATVRSRLGAKLIAVPTGDGVGSFEIDRTEVSVGEYRTCVEFGGCSEPQVKMVCNWNTGRTNHPMNCVAWSDAAEFCSWAGGRLPTDAEWTRAASGGDGRAYPWGNHSATCALAVVGNANPRGKDGCGRDSSWSVGEMSGDVGPFGVRDMGGNVAEWTSSRSLRGGDWIYPPTYARIASSRSGNPDTAKLNYGFRCAR